MPEHRLTENDRIAVPLQPPAGATAVIIRARVTKGPEPPPGETVRLFHLRLAKEGKVRETQIVELIYRDGSYTAGFSGFGGGKKAMENPENRLKLLPIHMGPFPRAAFGVTLTVPLNPGKKATVGLDSNSTGGKVAESPTEITPGSQPLELLLGFQGEGDLRSPDGWTISWADDGSAVEWVGATAPVTPPSTPPSPPIVTPPTPPAPPAPPAGIDWKAELRKDLTQLAAKYAAASGVDPSILFGLQLLLGMVNR